MKLYELADQYKELQQIGDDGLLPEHAVEDTLEAIAGEIQLKGENIGKLCKNWDSNIDVIDKQIAELSAKKRVLGNNKEQLKDYLRDNMERLGISKIDSPFFTINCVAGRDIAIIDNEQDLPDEFVDVVTTTKPNKSGITKALQAGEDVPGAHLEKSKSSIRIK